MRSRKRFWNSLYLRRRWLAVGIGIKRWLVLLVLGAIIMSVGWLDLLLAISRADWAPVGVLGVLTLQFLPPWLRVLLPLVVGGLVMLLSVINLGRNLVEPLRAGPGALVDSLYDYRLRDRGPHIVVIGGGTGMPGLLRGLTTYTSNITAIVTVADDGGSSGRLRKELGLLPPGDFRNNLAALARDESLMIQVLQYRFGTQVQTNGHEAVTSQSLGGHAFGNLLLAALTGIVERLEELPYTNPARS